VDFVFNKLVYGYGMKCYPIMPIYLKSIGFSIVLIGILEGVAGYCWIK
jgi:hypothetical protein